MQTKSVSALDVGDDFNGFVVDLSKLLKSQTDIFGEERVMVTESKVEEFRSIHLTNARVKGCRRFFKESRREEHSTRRDSKVAAMAHTKVVLVCRIINGNVFRSVENGSDRKSCRDVVGADVVVDRVETTKKDNVIEIPCSFVENVKTHGKKTDEGTRKCLCQLKVIIAAIGGKSNTVGELWMKTVSRKQPNFGVFLFGVRVGCGEIRKVTGDDGVSEGWVQFVEGDNARFDIGDASFGDSYVDNPAMLDLGQEVHHFQFLNKIQSINSYLAQINDVVSEPAGDRLVGIFVTVHEPIHSVVPVLVWLLGGEELAEAFMLKQRLRHGIKLVATKVKSSVRILLIEINSEGTRRPTRGRGGRHVSGGDGRRGSVPILLCGGGFDRSLRRQKMRVVAENWGMRRQNKLRGQLKKKTQERARGQWRQENELTLGRWEHVEMTDD